MPLSSSPNPELIITTLQRYTVFRGLTYLIYAGLWLQYTHHLLASTDTPYCRDVEPTLRTVLLVIAWIKLVVTIVFTCFILTNLLLKPTIEQFVLVVATLVVLGIFFYQIQFLNAVETSTTRTSDCDEIGPQRRRVIYTFTMVIFVFGVLLVLFGLTGGSFLEKIVAPNPRFTIRQGGRSRQ